MKTKTNTHVITREEYNQFFSEDITVRRKKELAEKINKRLHYFVQIFDSEYSSCDLYDEDSNFKYILNTVYKQNPKDLFEINKEVFTVYIQDNNSVDPNNILVSWLWDDSVVQKVLDKIEVVKNRKEKEDSYFEHNKRIILEKVRSILTDSEKAFLKASLGIVIEL